jgi:hypothetical protein
MSVPRAVLMAGVLVSTGLLVAPGQAQPLAEPRPVAEAASGADDIRALEQQVESVLAEARRQQIELGVQRQRLATAESANAWLPLLFMALAALVMVCGALALRVWHMRRQLAQWQGMARNAVPAPAAPPAGDPDAAAVEPPRPPERPLLGHLGAAPVRLPAELAPVQPRPLPALRDLGTGTRDFSFGTSVPPRPVSVEELLDLDQQVEFFLALGQAQSAIDLLLGHVRSTGGTNAQPYFKLLEIYRDQGDEEAYERTRERFNQRFNALAPDWTGDLAGGRLLEDYPEVVQRLQRAWPQPQRVVAELDSLMLRRADLEPFDLPAYRDLLLLHALARDLPADAAVDGDTPVVSPTVAASPTTPAFLARVVPPEPAPSDAAAQATVDLLLPLGEQMLEITLPQPHLADRPLAQSMLADWVFSRAARQRGPGTGVGDGLAGEPSAAAMRLDLDLSEHAPAPREFTRPAAFTDIDMRRDRRLSDLGGLEDGDPLPSRR